MGMATKKPTPTEYKGVRFRSKSEAIFARCLDIADEFHWYYESCPHEDPHGNRFQLPPMKMHQWDFWVDATDRKHKWNEIEEFFIEYKPARPTETYIANLISKVDSWSDLETFELHNQFNAMIVWGNPWQPAYPSFTYGVIPIRLHGQHCGPSKEQWESKRCGQNMTAEFVLNIGERIVRKAKSYRFDLKH